MDAVAGHDRAGLLGVAEILELPRHRRDARVEDAPGNSARLAQNLRRLFGIALQFVAEAPALAIDLNAALHDHRPGDQNVVRRRQRTVALIGAEMCELRAKRVAPDHGVAAIARMTEIKRVRHFRNKAPHQFGVAAIAVAGQDQRVTADAFARAIAANGLHTANIAIGSGEQRLGHAFGEIDNVAGLGGSAQPVDQLRAGARRQAVHPHAPNGRDN